MTYRKNNKININSQIKINQTQSSLLTLVLKGFNDIYQVVYKFSNVIRKNFSYKNFLIEIIFKNKFNFKNLRLVQYS